MISCKRASGAFRKNIKEKTVAIVLAGGGGKRMNTPVPKQFLELAGKPVIVYSLERFEKSGLISDIVVVCCEEYTGNLSELIAQNNIKKVYKIVPGGKTRQESSFRGVKNCPPHTEFVLIHDAVRPFICDKLIEDTLAAARTAGAAGAVIDTADTIIMKEAGFVREIPDRRKLGRIQTPQGFRYETILKAHEWALRNNITGFTDDCGLVLSMGGPVKVVQGSALNIKLTDRADLFLAEEFVRGGER